MVKRIAVCGLGYVGLPVAVAFSRRFDVVGFDVDKRRITSLKQGEDWTGEIERDALLASPMQFTDQVSELEGCDFFVVAVPTPVDEKNNPDFSLLVRACRSIGPVLRPGSIVVFESTVHPGATEEICGPELEKVSGLRCGVDFKLGYSPERINPGDREHPLEKIVKIVSGQDAESLEIIAGVYEQIIDAGVHRASSIKVAEAAKVLENTQRDINIALMNEMSKICDLVGIRTAEVLEAAGTKWNFLKFTPGLVGGHCIGVDPYYLTSKAQELGYHPEVILSGRRINDGMASHVASRVVQTLARNGRLNAATRVGILGMTFKENVPDIRNSKVVDLYRALGDYGITPVACDPMVDVEQMRHEYGISLVERDQFRDLDVLILAVPHRETMASFWEELPQLVKADGLVCDLKSVLDSRRLPSGLLYWTL
ncbi:MAG: nucleotide sugar dehydrogenase [Achromobacter sp.]|uniref:UDP-N-acetyl-D-glucosamine 6-dehydrogenase n=1 Tax=Achromobacter insuavis TaxID=1287735 RepID=A0A6J4ZKG2_9BURK|nr:MULTISPECIES: nucleotide sugar dehydrogenase [Achromobacter]MBN9638688.1 nucleotide sugar dehydrogenase [Achromobacter sp.]CAB3633212.1 UDP-N-acetyl-D-glucosamine 6-dehydrogenase [Achromobacter insuavis]CUJ20227.1 GDP-mannose 6-dehydrogenase [Achromobacter sp. 2789STDY5608633]CUJ41085.1 GDP-mannose 6-dehydrogenase [Achromobacter sp. 2789STDY5608628]